MRKKQPRNVVFRFDEPEAAYRVPHLLHDMKIVLVDLLEIFWSYWFVTTWHAVLWMALETNQLVHLFRDICNDLYTGRSATDYADAFSREFDLGPPLSGMAKLPGKS